ncbi:MAG: hypothetical protein K6L73_01580 [Cellvibrionaceae bacterium]
MTEAGQANSQTDNSSSGAPSNDHIDAINQTFELFRINYHNQYYKAFSDVEIVNSAKRLWFDSLQHLPATTILQGAKYVIQNSEFLPTLNAMLKACTRSADGLPDIHDAYVEACTAPNPKAEHNWSHLAVYHAGRACGWLYLEGTEERLAYPIFEQHYQNICQRILQGEELSQPEIKALPQESAVPLPREQQQEKLAALKALLDNDN